MCGHALFAWHARIYIGNRLPSLSAVYILTPTNGKNKHAAVLFFYVERDRERSKSTVVVTPIEVTGGVVLCLTKSSRTILAAYGNSTEFKMFVFSLYVFSTSQTPNVIGFQIHSTLLLPQSKSGFWRFFSTFPVFDPPSLISSHPPIHGNQSSVSG